MSDTKDTWILTQEYAGKFYAVSDEYAEMITLK